MIKIVIACGGGFSSSYVASRMKKKITELGLQDQASVDFISFGLLHNHLDEFDVVVCCPHLRIGMNSFMEKHQPKIPFYVLPQRMYGMMDFEQVYKDALDIMQIYREKGENPVCFPNEEDFIHIKRDKSFRDTYGDYHQHIR